MGVVGKILLAVIRLVVGVWGTVFNWAYCIVSNPGQIVKNYAKIRSKPSKPIKDGDTDATFIPTAGTKTPYISEFEAANNETLADVWNWSVARYKEKKLLGTRDILGEEDEVQPNGKMFKKLELGDYRWMSYEEVDTLADNFGRGLRVLGQQPGENVCLYADTRAEWMVAAQASFKQSFPVVTIYTNLGEEAVVHGLAETKAEVVITSHELLPKFKKILAGNKDSVKIIVYMENPIKRTIVEGFRDNVRIISFWDVLALGKKTANNNMMDVTAEPVSPTAETPAIIMYTSGSTGVPKGVVLTHGNITKALSGFLYNLNPLPDDMYIAYLPLAHVLELIGETMCIVWGTGVGYSHPNTLTDKSTMVKRGHKGDASVLKPTIMFCVPLILDRIYKGVTENIRKKGEFVSALMDFCIKYKLNCTRRGEVTPIMDKLIFRSIRLLVGGRVRAILAGGAPLSEDTHDYLRTVLGAIILQGYGLTETSACGAIMSFEENSTGRVGPPVQGVHIRLVNWEEGNYTVTDKPWPRGEIYIGGANVAQGYYKNKDKTEEEFFTDEEDRRWFKTGDVGQIEGDGTLRIIDRKKDLVKLQFGEYVSLGKVESVLKGCPVVANVCIFGESSKSYVVAVICPVKEILIEIAKKFGKEEMAWEEMMVDKDLTGAVLREVINHGKGARLEKFEVPGAVTLTGIEWTPETGLVTAALKLKRKPLQNHYKADNDRMYGNN
eukprot:GFUD01031845.1.p1 GENE.GFUD01031845.1~~GFUD01031845.1.p1  ORF type:complete len:722 (+),score=229.22 GFUD01031845.1:206-2371(+)